MKIKIETELQLDVNLYQLKTGNLLIHIYFASGERYQYWAELGLHGGGVVYFDIEDYTNHECETVGRIEITAENPEEEELLNRIPLHTRDKESDYFLLIPRDKIWTLKEKQISSCRHNW